DVKQRRVDVRDLEFDDAIPDDKAIPERNSGKRHQSEENRKERRQIVESLVGSDRYDILLREHFQHIGHAMKHSQHPKAKDVGTVRANTILDKSRLLPLHPRVKSGQVQCSEKDNSRQHQLDDQEFHHVPPPPCLTVATSTPSAPIVS